MTAPNLVQVLFDRYGIERDDSGTSYADAARMFPYTLPEHALRFSGLPDVRRQVKHSGSHYFDKGAIAAFGGGTHKAYPNKGGASLFAHRFWIESKQDVPSSYSEEVGPRIYQIAWASQYEPDGLISIEKLGSWESILDARAAARNLAEAVEAVRP